MTGPLFNAGQTAGQVRSAEADTAAAVAAYQQTVFNALRETNDALVGAVKKREEAAAQKLRVGALREYARLSRVRFNNGYAGYIETLYAENELFSAELAAVRTYADQYTQIVAVFKAMGGGWIDLADAGTTAGQPPTVRERAAQQPLF